MKPPYKSVNNYFTVALFYETRHATADTSRETLPSPIFSLYSDIPGLINAQQTFIDERDPTGYKWAMKYLNSWKHWNLLCRLPWFQEALAIWQDALKNDLKSQAIAKIIEISSSETAQALPAAKYIAEEGWNAKEATRGRPSKEEVDGKLKQAMRAASVVTEDADRIGLTVINGGKQSRGN
jgi:hypothetical protein